MKGVGVVVCNGWTPRGEAYPVPRARALVSVRHCSLRGLWDCFAVYCSSPSASTHAAHRSVSLTPLGRSSSARHRRKCHGAVHLPSAPSLGATCTLQWQTAARR